MRNETLCQVCPLRLGGCHAVHSDEEVDFIQQFKDQEKTLDAGQAILHEGAESSSLFTLRSGWAFRYRTLTDGRRQILNFLLPGDFIGLQAELNGRLPYGVESLTPVRLCTFRRDNLWELFRHFPSLGYDITWLAAHDELIADENLLSVGRRSATERIAMLLVHLYKRAGQSGDRDERGILFPITQQHIADALGLSLVHVNKTLRKLEQLDLHEIRNGRLILRNVKALQRIADYYELPMRNRPLI